jgi:ribose transport system permease protein
MILRSRHKLLPDLGNGTIVLSLVTGIFAIMSPHFLDLTNLVNIVVQASSIAIVAVGITCTLLTAGIDLSVGSTMFVTAVVAGKMVISGYSLVATISAALAVGLAFGVINAILVAYVSMQPFIATLGTLFLGRGLALQMTQTRSMNLPEDFARLGAARIIGIPLPIVILAALTIAVHFILSKTVFGRQIYAVGASMQGARKAGINSRRVLALTYVICGVCAALGGLVALSQLGTVSQTFGAQREFAAVSAAVLGGTSLFGGRGKVFPGTLIGALLIQAVENGLVMVNADPYIYPLTGAVVIFATVMVDSLRHERMLKLGRRKIRVEEESAIAS